MSKYTTEVRFICENAAGLTESGDYSDIDSILDKARGKIFDFSYPIFDENYRATLENKILKHYYTREIGAETVGLWKLFLNTKMNEIMPYYNQLYKSTLIEFNPMYDVDLTTNSQKIDNGNRDKTGSFTEENSYRDNGSFSKEDTSTESGSYSENKDISESGSYSETKVLDGEEHSSTSGSNESSTTGTDTISTTNTEAKKNDHWDYYSDTPQGGINGLANNTYLTNARHITDDTTGSTSGTSGTNTNSSSTEGETSSNTDTTKDDTTTVNGSTTKTVDEDTTGTTSKSGSGTSSGSNSGSGSGEKSGTNESNEVIRNTEDYLHHVVGKTGGVSYSKMLKEFRDTFLNIDMMIIKDLRPLFMNLW